MAVAVTSVQGNGAYAVALCGFAAQSIAGLTASLAVVLHDNVTWASVATAMSALAYLLVRRTAKR